MPPNNKIEYKASALRDLKKLDRQAAERVMDDAEAALGKDADAGIPLKGNFKGLFKYRVGDYRVIYAKTREGVLILRIGHRSTVYR